MSNKLVKNKLGWPMATLAILTFAVGQSLASAPMAKAAMQMGPPTCGQSPSVLPSVVPSPATTAFVDNVGQPPVATADSANHYTLSAHMDTHSFATGWPAVPTMGYDAVSVAGGVNTVLSHMAYLGPTIITKQGTPVQVTIKNDLPAGVDVFPQWGLMNNNNTTVLHRHGGLQPALSDGTPDQMVAPGGGTRTNDYPNNQAALGCHRGGHRLAVPAGAGRGDELLQVGPDVRAGDVTPNRGELAVDQVLQPWVDPSGDQQEGDERSGTGIG